MKILESYVPNGTIKVDYIEIAYNLTQDNDPSFWFYGASHIDFLRYGYFRLIDLIVYRDV